MPRGPTPAALCLRALWALGFVCDVYLLSGANCNH